MIALTFGLGIMVEPRQAFAHGDSGGTQLPKDAPPVTPDGEQAKAILKRIEGDADAMKIAKDAVARGEKALARAQAAKLSGDDEGARLLSNVALEIAKSADASLRAAAAEKKAADEETEAQKVADELTRMKTLLAETQAAASQIAAELAKAKEDAAAKSGDAAKAERDRLDKANRKQPADKAKPKGKGEPPAPKNDGGGKK